MTYIQNTDQPPALVTQVAALVARAFLNWAAGSLGLAGLLTSDQQTQFIAIGGALAMGALSLGWSWVQKLNAHQGLKAAIAAPEGKAS
jgi:hypothetical protein